MTDTLVMDTPGLTCHCTKSYICVTCAQKVKEKRDRQR